MNYNIPNDNNIDILTIKLDEMTKMLNDRDDMLNKERRRLKIFNRIITRANESGTQKELVNGILSSSIELLNFDIGVIYLIRGGETKLVAGYNVDDNLNKVLNGMCVQQLLQKSVLSSEKPKFYKNFNVNYPEHSEMLGGIKSLVTIPIIFDDEVKGCINLASYEVEEIPKSDCEILVTLGKHLAHVLYRLDIELSLEDQLFQLSASNQEMVATMEEMRSYVDRVEEMYAHLKEENSCSVVKSPVLGVVDAQ